MKGTQEIEYPCEWQRSDKLQVQQDGTVHSDLPEVQRLILQMDLNSPRLIQWRLMYQRIVELAATHDRRLLNRLLRASAVSERRARLLPDRPFIVDVTKAADQFGLRPEQIEALRRAIIQGTGQEGF